MRVAAILAELEAGGDEAGYFRARGRRAAERLHKAGVYKQFDKSVETWGKRAGSMATTMSSVLYNFTKWTYETLKGGFEIQIDEARDYPDALRWVGEGFIEYLSRHISGRKVEVTSQRPRADRVVYSARLD